jgi:hypothetical protein
MLKAKGVMGYKDSGAENEKATAGLPHSKYKCTQE